ncbi:MAG: tetratricopeptide repeat protein [Anaerolineales bacterium]|nr:tetratricopeptide repeat protein [Anaerolineales bacterium]
METFSPVNWEELKLLADKLARPGEGPGQTIESEWQIIEQSLSALVAIQDWKGIIRLREMFSFLIIGDTTGGLLVLQRLNEAAIQSAKQMNEIALTARFLHDEGHNLHRQGYHKRAIEAFEQSANLYQQIREEFRALESIYMTALCYRALGKRKTSKQILSQVLERIDENDPWRTNPLHVMAWLEQDEWRLLESERLLREILAIHEKHSDFFSGQRAVALSDLGEILGLQGRIQEALEAFRQSLAITARSSGLANRNEARTKLKMAELLARCGDYGFSLRLLDEADNSIRGYGHYYDLMWQIELARAFVYWRQRNFEGVIRKLRRVLWYRRYLRLSNSSLAKRLAERLRKGVSLPR